MTLKRLEIFVILVIIAMIGLVYALTTPPAFAPTQVSQNQDQKQIAVGEPNPSGVVEYTGQEGKTALDLLKSYHQVEVKSYSFGDMVTAIDGIKADDKRFWSFYVNGKLSEVGASQYITKKGDKIEWKLEEIKQ